MPEHHLQFEPGQIRAETEMLADAERDVLIGITGDVEGIRITEDALIAIGRWIEQRKVVAGANLLSAELDIFSRLAGELNHWRSPSQDFLDRGRDQRWIAFE